MLDLRGTTPLIRFLTLLGLLLLPWEAGAWESGWRSASAEPNAESIISDTLVCRPLGLVATGVGSALFVVASPWAVASGNTPVVAEKLVYEPARFTFTRPLGSPECSGGIGALLMLGLSVR